MPDTYRLKTSDVTAFQWQGEHVKGHCVSTSFYVAEQKYKMILMVGGGLGHACVGDWVVTDAYGFERPMSTEQFEQMYAPVIDPDDCDAPPPLSTETIQVQLVEGGYVGPNCGADDN